MSVASPYQTLLDGIPTVERVARVQGSDTHYWVYGSDEADTTLIVVHGYRGEHHGLEPVIAQLLGSGARVRVISPDLPGFGHSTALGFTAHDIDGYAAWLTAFVESLRLDGTAVILGHSFGSIVVSAAIARGLVTPRLILVNPIAAPALSGPNGFMSRVTLGYYRLARALPARIGARLLSNWLIVRGMSLILVETRDAQLRRWIHSQHHSYFSRYANRDSVVEGFEASISNDVSMFASDITVPTLLIAAERDPISTVAAQRRIQQLFPNARLVVLGGVGHLVHYEKPREAAEAIAAFLAEAPVSGPAE